MKRFLFHLIGIPLVLVCSAIGFLAYLICDFIAYGWRSAADFCDKMAGIERHPPFDMSSLNRSNDNANL